MGGIAREPTRWGAIRCTVAAGVLAVSGQSGVFSSATRVSPGRYRLQCNTLSWPAARTIVLVSGESDVSAPTLAQVQRIDDQTIDIRFDNFASFPEPSAFSVFIVSV